MGKMTITEALSELNLISKKLDKQRHALKGACLKYSEHTDPYASDGGAKAFYNKTKQSIVDLEDNLVKIRKAIHAKNIETEITIKGLTKTIDEWLSWKKDIYEGSKNSLNDIENIINREVEEIKKNPKVKKDEADNVVLLTLEPSEDLAEIEKSKERLLTIYENLDGQLSLKNATTIIEY